MCFALFTSRTTYHFGKELSILSSQNVVLTVF
jgi:hypothetical protein